MIWTFGYTHQIQLYNLWWNCIFSLLELHFWMNEGIQCPHIPPFYHHYAISITYNFNSNNHSQSLIGFRVKKVGKYDQKSPNRNILRLMLWKLDINHGDCNGAPINNNIFQQADIKHNELTYSNALRFYFFVMWGHIEFAFMGVEMERIKVDIIETFRFCVYG